MQNNQIWKACCIAAVVISVLTFTPLVTPKGVHQPELMGMPYTLWAGIIESILLVLLTYIGTRVHPGNKTEE